MMADMEKLRDGVRRSLPEVERIQDTNLRDKVVEAWVLSLSTSEFAAIEVEDFFFDEQMILIRKAKGGKHRYVPILPELAQELRTHLRQRMRGYLFETNRNTAFSPRRLQQRVKETAALAGITKRVSPHILRHSVATTLLEQRMPLEQIQQFLGHAQLDTTQIYATATSAMIKKSYQQALSREPGVLTQGC